MVGWRRTRADDAGCERGDAPNRAPGGLTFVVTRQLAGVARAVYKGYTR